MYICTSERLLNSGSVWSKSQLYVFYSSLLCPNEPRMVKHYPKRWSYQKSSTSEKKWRTKICKESSASARSASLSVWKLDNLKETTCPQLIRDVDMILGNASDTVFFLCFDHWQVQVQVRSLALILTHWQYYPHQFKLSNFWTHWHSDSRTRTRHCQLFKYSHSLNSVG